MYLSTNCQPLVTTCLLDLWAADAVVESAAAESVAVDASAAAAAAAAACLVVARTWVADD